MIKWHRRGTLALLLLPLLSGTGAAWNAHNITSTSVDIYCTSGGFDPSQYRLDEEGGTPIKL